jgi:hypothetical protein
MQTFERLITSKAMAKVLNYGVHRTRIQFKVGHQWLAPVVPAPQEAEIRIKV